MARLDPVLGPDQAVVEIPVHHVASVVRGPDGVRVSVVVNQTLAAAINDALNAEATP